MKAEKILTLEEASKCKFFYKYNDDFYAYKKTFISPLFIIKDGKIIQTKDDVKDFKFINDKFYWWKDFNNKEYTEQI